ncbi:hypothetical protein AMECASPLE_035485 [Ameca splendens]|uniref:Uncharacterized protein n=1 Tax=Ameca splendens TaxID=208324 RepID=A0ABV0Y7G1_9TELE
MHTALLLSCWSNRLVFQLSKLDTALTLSGLSLAMNIPWVFTVVLSVLVLLSNMPLLPPGLSVKCDMLAALSPTSQSYQTAEEAEQLGLYAYVFFGSGKFDLLTLMHLLLPINLSCLVRCCKHVI